MACSDSLQDLCSVSATTISPIGRLLFARVSYVVLAPTNRRSVVVSNKIIVVSLDSEETKQQKERIEEN